MGKRRLTLYSKTIVRSGHFWAMIVSAMFVPNPQKSYLSDWFGTNASTITLCAQVWVPTKKNGENWQNRTLYGAEFLQGPYLQTGAPPFFLRFIAKSTSNSTQKAPFFRPRHASKCQTQEFSVFIS